MFLLTVRDRFFRSSTVGLNVTVEGQDLVTAWGNPISLATPPDRPISISTALYARRYVTAATSRSNQGPGRRGQLGQRATSPGACTPAPATDDDPASLGVQA